MHKRAFDIITSHKMKHLSNKDIWDEACWENASDEGFNDGVENDHIRWSKCW